VDGRARGTSHTAGAALLIGSSDRLSHSLIHGVRPNVVLLHRRPFIALRNNGAPKAKTSG